MKVRKLSRLLCTLGLFLNLCSCDTTYKIDGFIFEYKNKRYYPTQEIYFHYDLDIDACPNYNHYEIKYFKKHYEEWTSFISNGKVIVPIQHSEFKGLNVTTTQGYEIFLKKNNYKMYINNCPYCAGNCN